jgi:NAD(P)-dependent dehydrogenase (short-subunit alcohol dehydrogenase family)
MAVSIDGVVFGTKHAIPAMAANGGGSIINMASIAAIQGEPTFAAYSAAKGAIDAYTRATAAHSIKHGRNVRCNSVLPAGAISLFDIFDHAEMRGDIRFEREEMQQPFAEGVDGLDLEPPGRLHRAREKPPCEGEIRRREGRARPADFGFKGGVVQHGPFRQRVEDAQRHIGRRSLGEGEAEDF